MPMINLAAKCVSFLFTLLNYDSFSCHASECPQMPCGKGYSFTHKDGYYIFLGKCEVNGNSKYLFIGALCSGIMSMSVFMAAFVSIMLDLRGIPLIKRLISLLFGIIGTIFANVLRIFLLVGIHYYYGERWLEFFHAHLGWCIFFIWMAIFWNIAISYCRNGTKS
jgi:archaeosortase C (PEF-CTERM variant)